MPIDFVAYRGDSAIHDGRIDSVVGGGDQVRVRIATADGRALAYSFHGVSFTSPDSPEGMILYSLSELRAPEPNRRFLFTNSDVDRPDFEVVALGFSEEWIVSSS